MPKPTRLDYCPYLLSSPVNYTLTHFADHSAAFSHDRINRYLAGDRLAPRLVWEHVQPDLSVAPTGYVIFDDTVLDKRHARKIALARRQYSGHANGVINGIGVVEQVHREAKQVTGLEKCQGRLPRIVRNHIGCAFLVWVRLAPVADQTGQSVYQVKYGLLTQYLKQQLKTPTVQMKLA